MFDVSQGKIERVMVYAGKKLGSVPVGRGKM